MIWQTSLHLNKEVMLLRSESNMKHAMPILRGLSSMCSSLFLATSL